MGMVSSWIRAPFEAAVMLFARASNGVWRESPGVATGGVGAVPLIDAPISSGSLDRSSARDLLWATWIGLAAGIAVMAYGGDVAGDDTFIYMRYVDNALHGGGFTYNLGERSYGVTSLLWTLLMTPIAALFGNVVATWKAATLVLSAARAALLLLLLRRVGAPRPWAAALVAVALLEPHSFRWSNSGMEGALTLFTLTAIAWLHCDARGGRARALMLGCAIGALPFVRPELGVLSLGVGVVAWRARSAERVAIVASAALTVALCLGLAVFAMGSALPDTAAAKALFSRQSSSTYGLFTCAKLLISGACGALLLLLLRPRDRSPVASWRAVTIAAVGVAVAYLALRNQLVSTRYAVYLSAPIVLAGVLLVAEALGRGARDRLIRVAIGLQIAASAAVLVFIFPVTRVSEIRDIHAFNDEIQGALPRDARVAISEIGIYGFYSGRYIIDLFGLTDPAVLRWARQHGPPRTAAAREDLLLARGATHFIDAFAEELPLQGEHLRFTPIAEHLVVRDNFSAGKLVPSRWRLYRLDPLEPTAARDRALGR